MLKKIIVCLFLCGLSFMACAQTLGVGILKGQVTDESGAVIPGAKVTASGPGGVVKSATAIADGTYTLPGLAPGAWTVQAASPGMTQHQPAKINVSAGTQMLNIQLQVEVEKQEITVQEQGNNTVSVDPSNNAGSLVLKGEDLDSLSDDPDDLQQDLQALAGPAAGPDGGQIYIDGFTGGRLPPKESIREIRINQNPFSSEYDRLGFGRIEIFTKPGTDKFHGSANFNISDGQFNSRNPFLTPAAGKAFDMPDFQTKQYEGYISGPLSKKASFFFDFDRRQIDDSAVINARIVDPATFLEEPYSTASPTPQRRTSFSPRLDYALSPNNTLMARYTYTRNNIEDAAVGNFNLPSTEYARLITQQTGQLTETSVIHSKWINETRFQIMNNSANMNGNLLPVINVAGAEVTGGSGVGLSSSLTRNQELQNYTSTTFGTHSIKFGVRVRAEEISDISQNNFGGSFYFGAPSGLSNPINPATGLPYTSLDNYAITLSDLQQGVPIGTIISQGFGPTQFSLNAGNPKAGVNMVDVGVFYQDDWRLKPNVTLSLGGRYETQTNIHDYSDFAPRVGIAWAPGGNSTGGLVRPKFVIRGGFGVFYSRINDSLTLQQIRFTNGNQQSYQVNIEQCAQLPGTCPLAYFPNVPPIERSGGLFAIAGALPSGSEHSCALYRADRRRDRAAVAVQYQSCDQLHEYARRA